MRQASGIGMLGDTTLPSASSELSKIGAESVLPVLSGLATVAAGAWLV